MRRNAQDGHPPANLKTHRPDAANLARYSPALVVKPAACPECGAYALKVRRTIRAARPEGGYNVIRYVKCKDCQANSKLVVTLAPTTLTTRRPPE